jgi:integrase
MRIRLTEKKIRGLAASKPPIDILHEKTPSAGLRVSTLGAKIWFYIYRSPVVRDEHGQAKQRRAYLGYHLSGRCPDRPTAGRDLVPMSLDEFERAYYAFRAELGKGIDPLTVGVSLPQKGRWIAPETIPDLVRPLYPEGYREGTFAALVVDYFRHHAVVNLKARTVRNYKYVAKSFAAVLAHRVPGEISDLEVREVMTAVEKRAPQMVREVKKVLSAIFEYARSHWHLSGNPARGLRVTVKRAKRDRWLSDGELTAALSACAELTDRKAADVYRLILYSMCRPGEAAYVCAEDLLISNGERVWRMYGKNGHEFLVPLLGPIGEILHRRSLEVGGRGPLFWARDSRVTYPEPLRLANVEFRRLSGLENIRPHDFRRTGRTHIPALGVPESVAEALLNHVKGEIEGTYNLYNYWPERKQALGLWHEKLARLEGEAHQRAA